MACMAKLNVMNSQTGCSPANAAPTVRPQNPDSVIGLSITLLSPNRSRRPFVTLYLLSTCQHAFFELYAPLDVDCIRLQLSVAAASAVWFTTTLQLWCDYFWETHAPLYCATSSPSTKTFGLDSISSAIASFRASLTVISLLPLSEAYVLHLDTAGAETLWKVDLGRAEGEERRSWAAGRRRREPTMAACVRE